MPLFFEKRVQKELFAVLYTTQSQYGTEEVQQTWRHLPTTN